MMSATTTLSPTEEDNDRALRIAAMDLRRLLQCMQGNMPSDLTWQSILSRAHMAQDLLQQVQRGWHEAIYSDETARERDEESLRELQFQVNQAVKQAKEEAAERKGNEVDLIQEIFYPQEEEGENASESGSDIEEEPEEEEETPIKKESHVHMSTKQDVEELQKAQREQLEEEIAHMAARLKESTQRMNTTLRGQTEDLDEMEDLATKNVEKVSKVADDVTEHNKKTWRNTIATWTIMFAVLGSFMFCFMTIRMVPRRPNKCLFFCGKPECSTMADGSVVCVDTRGKLYVKKQAPQHIDQQEHAEEKQEEVKSERVKECVVGLDGECVEISSTVADEQEEVINEDESEVDDTNQDVCNEAGECEAHYEDVDLPNEELACATDEVGPDEGHVTTNEPAEDSDDDVQDDNTKEKQVTSSAEQEIVDAEESEADYTHNNVEARHKDDEPSIEATDDDDPGHGVLMANEQAESTVEDQEDEVTEEPLTFTVDDVRRAARLGDAFRLEQYLSVKPDYGILPDGNGWQPIHEAVRAVHMECVALLMSLAHADVNARTGPVSGFKTPLWIAKWVGLDDSHNLVRFLESHGAISNGPYPLDEEEEVDNEAGENPPNMERLRRASVTTHEELESEKQDFTADDVRRAAARGDAPLLKRYLYLMPEYAGVPDENGWHPIHEATSAKDIECAEILLRDYEVDVNARTGLVADGMTSLWMAYHQLGLDDSHDLVRLLKSYGAVSLGQSEDLPFIPKDNFSPEQLNTFTLEDLHLAAAAGDDIRVAQYIVTKPHLIDARDKNGWRALHEAVRMGRRISTQLLVNSGSNIDGLTGDGWSPLGLALHLHGKDHPVTRVLRKYGGKAVFGRLG